MTTKPRKILKKTWKLVKSHTYTRCIYLMRTKRTIMPSAGARHALINMDPWFLNHDRGRYGFLLSKYFQDADYNVAVRTTRHFYWNLSAYKKQLMALDLHFVRELPNPANSVLLIQADGSTKTIQLTYGFEVLQDKSQDCIAPYTVHPNVYKSFASPAVLETYRQSPRAMRILFSGNTDEKQYERKDLETTFNMLSRRSVLQQVIKRFENTPALEILKEPGLLEQYFDREETRKIIINVAKTDPSLWLKTLSQSSFFICAPGVWMPWCHNLIEAMSVGTIPILQYAHLMSPKLEHKKNCLVFNHPEELSEVLQMALEMSEEEIAALRGGVIDYFGQHLSLSSVKNKIQVFCTSNKDLMKVALPYIPKRSASVPGSLEAP